MWVRFPLLPSSPCPSVAGVSPQILSCRERGETSFLYVQSVSSKPAWSETLRSPANTTELRPPFHTRELSLHRCSLSLKPFCSAGKNFSFEFSKPAKKWGGGKGLQSRGEPTWRPEGEFLGGGPPGQREPRRPGQARPRLRAEG